MQEKIAKWEEEIEKIQAQQRDYNKKCQEKIKDLRQKIAFEKKQMQLENDRLIAETVRSFFGTVDETNLELFKEKIQSLTEEGAEHEEQEDHIPRFGG
jgi:lipid II:glycine glycyltransferase (peptidoglycan interpeptide bridge formation enzyme)